MKLLLYSAATSLVLSFLLTPLFVRFLIRIRILDKGGRRKIHKGYIPSMGGVVIFASFLFSIIVWLPEFVLGDGRFMMAAMVLMAITGIRDDIDPLSPTIKLLIQVVAASMVAVVVTDVRLDSLYGFFGVYDIAPWLGYVLSILFILFITNAFNLIDGVDGLAGGVAFVSLLFLGVWFYLVGNQTDAIFLICFAGAILGFLYYNWQPASLFMGDTGSLVLGFVLSVSTLKFISMNGALPVESSYKFHAVLSSGMAFVLLPVFDTIRVFLLRLSQKHSPFLPDKQHLHHLLIRKGYTHAGASRIILIGYCVVGGIILFISWENWMSDWIILLVLLLLLMLIDRYLFFSLRRHYKR